MVYSETIWILCEQHRAIQRHMEVNINPNAKHCTKCTMYMAQPKSCIANLLQHNNQLVQTVTTAKDWGTVNRLSQHVCTVKTAKDWDTVKRLRKHVHTVKTAKDWNTVKRLGQHVSKQSVREINNILIINWEWPMQSFECWRTVELS